MSKDFSIDEYKQTFLSAERLEELYDRKLFKLFVPRANGGLELSLDEGTKQLTEIAAVQGGMGWTVNLGAGANWFVGFFNEIAAREIFDHPDAVIAGSGFASGKWQRNLPEGFIIDGKWSRCTGANHATFFSLNAQHPTEGLKTFVVPREKVALADEKWPIFGLRNSSSNAIMIHEQKIPERYCFQINAIQNSNAYEVHDIPFEIFARFCMSASFIGIVKGLCRRSIQCLSTGKAIDYIQEKVLPLIDSAESDLAEATNRLSFVINKGKGDLNHESVQEIKQSLGTRNLQLFYEVQQLFLIAGLPMVEEDSILHWDYRNVLTAIQHFMVKP